MSMGLLQRLAYHVFVCKSFHSFWEILGNLSTCRPGSQPRNQYGNPYQSMLLARQGTKANTTQLVDQQRPSASAQRQTSSLGRWRIFR